MLTCLGVTPLDFGPQENVELLKANLEQYGWKVVSTWAMGDELETLQRSAEADVNLVVSAVGLRAAKVLREKFGMPYVIGTPNQWMAEEISNALDKAVVRQPEQPTVYLQNRMRQDDRHHTDRRAGHDGIVGSGYREKVWDAHDPRTCVR